MSRVFVGDLASSETDASLRKRMSEYGEVVEAVVCKDKDKPKGYGFCVFSDETSAELCVTVEKQAGQRVWRVVTASNAHSETWLDEEYQLSPKVRDVRDHDILEWEASGRLGGRPLPW